MAKQPLGVLVLHGFTSSLDCVHGVQPPLESLGLPTRMPVLRGHGAASPDALRGVTWPDWVADANVALDDLLSEAERAVVFGHSMGGLVALTLAADRPAVDSLVVAAAAVQLSSIVAPGRPLALLAPAVAAALKVKDMPPKYADPALAQYDTNYAWAPTDAILSLFAFSRQTRRRLPEVRVPMLILQSRNDRTVMPRSAEIIYHGISTPADQKRIIWFERTEHEMFRDCESEQTIGAVVEFVRERAALVQKTNSH
jgi:carboxylesterase